MYVISSRDEFLRILADAQRVAGELAARSSHTAEPYELLGQQLVAAGESCSQAASGTTAQHEAVDLAAWARQIDTMAGQSADEGHAWLQTILPSLDHFYRSDQTVTATSSEATPAADAEVVTAAAGAVAASENAADSSEELIELGDDDLVEEPVEPYLVGTHVRVCLPSGGPYLGFVRHLREGHALVALGNGYQQWFELAQLQAGPAAGEQVATTDSQGQRLQGTLLEFARGRYLVQVGSGDERWIDWTELQALAASRS